MQRRSRATEPRVWAGDGGPARTAELNQPAACTVDSAGDVFIADTLNHRIAKVDASGVITTVAGTGQAGTSADGVTAVAAALNSPAGVAVDGNGDIFIADTGNNLIRQVTPERNDLHNRRERHGRLFGRWRRWRSRRRSTRRREW